MRKVVNKYSVCARSSYGWICASYFCSFGSAKDSTDGRKHYLWGKMLLSLLCSTSISCEWMFWFTRTVKDCGTLWKNRNKMGWQGLFHQNTLNGEHWTSLLKCILNGIYFFCWCIIDSWWTRRDRKFFSGCCFLSFSFLWASLLCLPVYMCQTWKRHACV